VTAPPLMLKSALPGVFNGVGIAQIGEARMRQNEAE
jgi:hypothetical protein